MEALSLRDPLRDMKVDPEIIEAFRTEIDGIIYEVLAGPDPVRSV